MFIFKVKSFSLYFFQFYVGTTNGRMYSFLYEDKFKDCKLIKTCHSEPVNDILFPP